MQKYWHAEVTILVICILNLVFKKLQICLGYVFKPVFLTTNFSGKQYYVNNTTRSSVSGEKYWWLNIMLGRRLGIVVIGRRNGNI